MDSRVNGARLLASLFPKHLQSPISALAWKEFHGHPGSPERTSLESPSPKAGRRREEVTSFPGEPTSQGQQGADPTGQSTVPQDPRFNFSSSLSYHVTLG